MPINPGQGAVPLIVDLDGTLVCVDTLHESLMSLISGNPLRAFSLPGWLRCGKAGFKARVADEVQADARSLPFRAEVIDLIARARKQGRPVFLVSAADQRQVDQVAAHLGVFDEAIGSDGRRNLGERAKAEYLVDRFGVAGFDYAGDSAADLAVWQQARCAITVAASDQTLRQLRKMDVQIEELVPKPGPVERLRAHIKAMRPHQWLKNLLIFVPALAAHNPAALSAALLAFMSFSLAASSVYLINDLMDLEVDRQHPRKCKRPFAAGTIPVSHGLVHAAALIVAAVALGALTTPAFLAVLGVYLALTFAYSLYLKRKQMIDIWTLAALYTIRIVAGAAATGVMLSEWMLGFSMFVFLSLAAVKRLSELTDLVKRGKDKTAGRGYLTSDIPVILGAVLAAGYSSVLVLALYVSSENVARMYSNPTLLWLICPLLLYWISRMAMISYRGEMHDDPIVFAIKDRVSLAVFAMSGGIAVAGTFVGPFA
ncbi:MAG: UbiA family prenyltransferase [Marinibacterium sp.]|nr:UbiA family prenyltransferase [Marinibacterium sp.]